MNKLTTEWCAYLLKDLQRQSITGCGIGRSQEGYLAALEIALPILEKQERGCQKCGGTGMADSGGTQPWGEQILVECDCKFEQQERGEGEWVEWGGGECPVDANAKVEFKTTSGAISRAKFLNWHHVVAGEDIIAYRIIPEQPTNQNGEQ
ncbi:hypothetical protein [Pantoea sp. 1B4]|uniref:hypothetical protein n=1 Tax=Pantoea sp. 1B4 TaxID=2804760 RepID=UPI001AA9813C|nr:hypothetical protein [Pantoea sp. 1B4]MBN1088102.1 hypothetical protein [Pantoea sp. 1B4]